MHLFTVLACSFVAGIPLSPGGPYNTNGGPKEGVINVHLVPHTHNDVGWLKTVEELYTGSKNDVQIASVQLIIDSVMASLAVDPNRTFQYVEMAFFSRWWRRANDLQRAQVIGFLKSGQLEFVNGGWVSNDEATPTFVDIIDQHTMGATWIGKEFGPSFNPTVGFQADPFGHSLFQAKAYGGMGMNAWFFGRSDFQDFAVRKATRTLESIHSGILAGSMDGYSPPDFFWWDVVSKDEPLNDDELLGEPNIEARLDAFVAHCRSQASAYNHPTESTQHILLTMGSDFTYLYAHSWFRNMDKLIHYGNIDGRLNFFYSHLSVYTASRHQQRHFRPETDEYQQRDFTPETHDNQQWDFTPVTDDYDWFPYCDGEAIANEAGQVVAAPQAHAFWTGYFTSRPILKRLVRVASAVLEVCRLAELRTSHPASSVQALWDALSIAQHHDAVSGTSKQRVADDYSQRLEVGIRDCLDFVNSQPGPSRTYVSMLQPVIPPVAAANPDVYFAYYVSSSGDAPERSGQASGAYIFRPHCPEGNVAACRPTRLEADWVKLEQFSDHVEWSVGPIPADWGIAGIEVVLVFEDPTVNNDDRVFWTDSNGYEWVKRIVNKRATWELLVTDPVAGNYYPITAGIAICAADDCLVVAPDRSVGGTSLEPGQIELMVHRRLFNDDQRGVNEPLNETTLGGEGIVVSGTTYFSKMKKSMKNEKIVFPVPRTQLRPKMEISGILPLVNVPRGTAILHVHRLDVPALCSPELDCVLLRLIGTHASHDRWLIALDNVFPDRRLVEAVELTLNGAKRRSDVHPLQWTHKKAETIFAEISIRNNQIRTFALHLANHEVSREKVILATM